MESKLLLPIFCVVLLLIVGDCVSTYYCLTTPSPGIRVWEANPLAEWLFQKVGLVPGLALHVVVKGILLVLLYRLTERSKVSRRIILGGMTGAALLMGYVNYSNWSIYLALVN